MHIEIGTSLWCWFHLTNIVLIIGITFIAEYQLYSGSL
jgi:hypothetical protein